LTQTVTFYHKSWKSTQIFDKSHVININNKPEDFPEPIRPDLIASEALVDFPKFMDHLKPKNKKWWEKWIEDQPLLLFLIPEGIIKMKN
jgi:hypothetical protein